ncbi:MAG: DNA adenine methylase [Pseudomonadota bacterium]
MSVTRPALRYHGAKFRLAPWVLQHVPPHLCYVEPFGGAAGVLLQKPRSYAEVYNDLDGDIVNFFQVLRDPGQRERLIEALTLTPYARDEFKGAYQPTAEVVERARRTAVRAQMGFGSAGATKGHTGFRKDTKREHSLSSHGWAGYPESLRNIAERFAGVVIENRDAIQVMAEHDGSETMHFVDPPYVHSTRVHSKGVKRGRCYKHEMDDEQHVTLLQSLLELEGMVALSGYDSELYRDMLVGWERRATLARISAGRGTGVRTEVLWLNPACSAALHGAQGGLFDEAAA